MKSLGICIGASTLSLVTLHKEENGPPVIRDRYRIYHHGDLQQAVHKALDTISSVESYHIAVTGRKFRNRINLTSIAEPEAVEWALQAAPSLHANASHLNAIVSAGGETILAYILGKGRRILSVETGNKCASGTGEFFLQQIRRMGLSLEEALKIGIVEQPYRISDRCSVFAKSDCTHAMNKGISKGRIAAGLGRMMADKVLEVLQRVPEKNVAVVGGCAQNAVMVRFLREELENIFIPEESPYFEALGCAYWALCHDTLPFPGYQNLLNRKTSSFSSFPALKAFGPQVDFKTMPQGLEFLEERCLLGLDVGSTTTKAVLVGERNAGIIASAYLRTNGDPVQASRECYGRLHEKLGDRSEAVNIVGVGVTGSGRQIAGLHAMTEGVVNEILAHATAALYFEKEVDTIFEIGGQDAKYTYIVNGVPADYAMNEACSAGTGSFLEEAAHEALGIAADEIADFAVQGMLPLNFNDQCAAFIGSDIKNAFQDGLSRENIIAGLVYSICMNYINRVKGSRPVGKKVFMQGGVCYNRAVPLAMACLTGKDIVVPPEPGLMGAFGVALEVRRRLATGVLPEGSFSLRQLKERTCDYSESFICNGGKERCDRKCEIIRVKIDGKVFPFGGACYRWYKLRTGEKRHSSNVELNLVAHYEKSVFPSSFLAKKSSYNGRKTIGINKSFFVNTYFPLFYHFFSGLDFKVILAGECEKEGRNQKNAPFCYPAEIAHGFFLNLLKNFPDYLFLPQIKGDFVGENLSKSMNCPLSQAEPYCLAAAFQYHPAYAGYKKEDRRVLKPVLDFSGGISQILPPLLEVTEKLGISEKRARLAFQEALRVQDSLRMEMKAAGSSFLERIEKNPEIQAVVLFGRAYNAFVSEANMGIPRKFTSHDVAVIPFNYLPFEGEPLPERMYWSAGRRILKGAHFVRNHPQLFGCYISNFSCGPDSFIIDYFRDIMGAKPSLTLELDSHVADAGLDTRIEAFLDIIQRYCMDSKVNTSLRPFSAAEMKAENNLPVYLDSAGRKHSVFDSRVHLIFPSMGRFLTEAAAAVFNGMGIRSTALPPADEEVLKLGRGHTSSKECLPLLLTVGSLLKYLKERNTEDELLLYFMPTASGPCRFGQYAVFFKGLINKLALPDVALFSLSAENSYAHLKKPAFIARVWVAVLVADIFEEIYSVLLANASHVSSARPVFEKAWKQVKQALESGQDTRYIKKVSIEAVRELRNIEISRKVEDTPYILITGEIFARYDDLARQYLVEKLAARGFAVHVSTLVEWVYYTQWCVHNNHSTGDYTFRDRWLLRLRNVFMKRYEKTFRSVFSASNLCLNRLENIDHIIKCARHLMNPALSGEAILTTGAALHEIVDHCCGVIALGPFGCMPNRIAESLLKREMTIEGKLRTDTSKSKVRSLLEEGPENLPFLPIESDGNRFPQVIEARLEAFLLQAKRLHEVIRDRKSC